MASQDIMFVVLDACNENAAQSTVINAFDVSEMLLFFGRFYFVRFVYLLGSRSRYSRSPPLLKSIYYYIFYDKRMRFCATSICLVCTRSELEPESTLSYWQNICIDSWRMCCWIFTRQLDRMPQLCPLGVILDNQLYIYTHFTWAGVISFFFSRNGSMFSQYHWSPLHCEIMIALAIMSIQTADRFTIIFSHDLYCREHSIVPAKWRKTIFN